MIKKKTNKKNKSSSTDKVKLLKKEVHSLEGAVNDTKEKNVRLLAEFDNYKRRITESIIEKNKYDGIDLIKEIIPIIDDIDRILNIESIIKEKSVYDGIVLIKNKFLSVLNDYGINSYESVGEEFNADFHEAIMMKKSKKASNIILEEFQRGYKYHDKVVRHSKVIVSEWREIIMKY